MKAPVFTIEDRDRARERLIRMGREDRRVVACAEVGSMAVGRGDRWSDLDLTFGLAAGVRAADVLADWAREIEEEFDAVQLFDLPFLSSIYRVFLFPGALQVDLSFTPASDFGALGPDFRLVFGETVERAHVLPPSAAYLFGLGAHHAVRARFSIERGRVWQAEYWISGVRDQALTLACLRLGLDPWNARGFDALPEEAKAPAGEALVRSLDRDELLRALARAIDGLLRESGAVPATAAKVEAQLRALTSEEWAGG